MDVIFVSRTNNRGVVIVNYLKKFFQWAHYPFIEDLILIFLDVFDVFVLDVTSLDTKALSLFTLEKFFYRCGQKEYKSLTAIANLK